jgi:hypothetical protein
VPSEKGGPSRDHGLARRDGALQPRAPSRLSRRVTRAQGPAKRVRSLLHHLVRGGLCRLHPSVGKAEQLLLLPLYPAAALLGGRTLAGSLDSAAPRLLRFATGLFAAGLVVVAAVSGS